MTSEKMDRKESERNLLQTLPCPESDAQLQAGVLLSNEIKRYVNQFRLIWPFYPENLKPAGYELTVGEEYAIGGQTGQLLSEPGKNEVRIPPFQVLIIKTRERVNLPRFLIARWNIKVALAYEGLLWVGGPQVDPGYVGHLFCPIYNLSDKEVTLRFGDPIALMDFVTTTAFIKDQSKEYTRPPKRLVFGDYKPETLKSALFTEAGKRIDEIDARVNKFETRLETSTGVVVALIAVLFTALAIFVTSGQGVQKTLPWWSFLSAGFSIIAIVASITAWVRSKQKVRREIPTPGELGRRLKKLEHSNRWLIIWTLILTAALAWMGFKFLWQTANFSYPKVDQTRQGERKENSLPQPATKSPPKP